MRGAVYHRVRIVYLSIPLAPAEPAMAAPRDPTVGVAQSVRAPDCGSGGRRFDSGRPPLGRAVAARARWRPPGPRRVDSFPIFPDLLTGQAVGLTIEVYRASLERSVHHGIRSRAGSLRFSGRLRPPAIFDNRGHEKRAGPSPASTVSRRFSCRPGMNARRTKGFNNADSEQ